MKERPIFRIILFSVLLKAVFFLFAVFSSKMQLVPQDYSLSYSGYLSMVQKNDAFWYNRIAKEGYPIINDIQELGFSEKEVYHQSAWAFFPFYPMLLGFTSRITGIEVEGIAILGSILFSAAAAVGFYLFAFYFYNDKERAINSTFLWMLFPFHYYFSMLYTEAIFFTFLIFSFISLVRKQYLLFSLLLIPLVLTRPNGAIMLIPLFLFFLENTGGLNRFTFNKHILFSKKNILNALSFLSAPIAFAGYCLYQYKMTGYYFAFSIAQDGWYREFMFPFLSFFRTGELSSQFNSIYTILVMLFAIFALRKLPLSLNILIWLSLMIPLTSGSVISMQRYIVTIFPLFLVMGMYVSLTSRKFLYLGLLFVLQLISFYFWIANHPFSY